ncbi:TetR/AcrR family transcriptional regulator C-terminal ligand-binding domain-containing protein [Streptomyces olivaceoviridis]|uniref:TetR/AcrR family transcriptional regulator C-terminal ligand-binding domain-containing protein n=1 Tax=Streptomyces olivaceoviridis TaxID=1921 RepID=UPI00332C5131
MLVDEDVERYARQAAQDLAGPVGGMLLHVLLTARLAPDGSGTAKLPPALLRRFGDLRAALDRAAARGEKVPSAQEFFDVVLAPMYAVLIFGTQSGSPESAELLIARLMRLTAAPRESAAPAAASP